MPEEHASQYRRARVRPAPGRVRALQAQAVHPGRLIELVRNENWDPRTDPLRSAWVDKVSVTIGRSEAEIQQAIEDGEADLNLDAVPPPVATSSGCPTTRRWPGGWRSRRPAASTT